MRLAAQFERPEVLVHPGGHVVPRLEGQPLQQVVGFFQRLREGSAVCEERGSKL
jgi:hypothetical protein